MVGVEAGGRPGEAGALGQAGEDLLPLGGGADGRGAVVGDGLAGLVVREQGQDLVQVADGIGVGGEDGGGGAGGEGLLGGEAAPSAQAVDGEGGLVQLGLDAGDVQSLTLRILA